MPKYKNLISRPQQNEIKAYHPMKIITCSIDYCLCIWLGCRNLENVFNNGKSQAASEISVVEKYKTQWEKAQYFLPKPNRNHVLRRRNY